MRRFLLSAGVAVLLIGGLITLNRAPAVAVERVEVPVADGVALETSVTRLAEVQDAQPALLLAHGFASSMRDMQGAADLWARRGYTVMTWSARGFGGSGGDIGLNDPDAEIADISVMVDLLADRDDVVQEAAGDPLVGMAGGSYGGGATLLTIAADDRIDAAVAVAAWHDLGRSLAPSRTSTGVPKAQWLSILFTAGLIPDVGDLVTGGVDGVASGAAFLDEAGGCGRFAPDLCAAYQASADGDILTSAAEDLLGRASLVGGLDDVTAPTLLVHALDDTLFGLEESLDNARALLDADAPMALRWVEGGHGGLSPEGSIGDLAALDWLDQHLSGQGQAEPVPMFGWVDQVSGGLRTAEQLPGPASRTDWPGPTDALADVMPPVTVDLYPQSDGTLAVADTVEPAGVGPALPLQHPAGGLPASLSTLPGLGQVGGLLPQIDIPGQSVTFTTDALADDLVIVGEPTLELYGVQPPVPAAGPAPPLFAKLYDVSPGGGRQLIQSAVNPMRLGTASAFWSVALTPISHRVVAGNRLALAFTTTDQGYDTGTQARIAELPLGSGSRLILPITTLEATATLPVAVRNLIPVALVLAVVAAWTIWTRRRETGLVHTGSAQRVHESDPAGVIEVRGLVKRYADGKIAVGGLDLTVLRGQVVGLLGPNGAGKTTTMRMLLGLIHPTEGTIRLLDQDMAASHPLLERVGVLVEGPGFAPYLSGRRNLQTYWAAGGRPPAEANMERALAVADLGDAIDKPTKAYSHGMRQRLAIAQALLGDPEVLILDEPTDGLDPDQIRRMRNLLAELGEQGVTILVSSHLLAEVEQMCTHVVVVNEGRVVASGPVEELMGAAQHVVVRTDDPEGARRVLATIDAAAPTAAGGVQVTLGRLSAADIVRTLVEGGIAVQSVTPRGRLEDTFLALTGGGADAS